MSNLISGKEAKLAWANGETVQIKNNIVGEDFYDLTGDNAKLGVFDLDFYSFRIKKRTITLNGVDVLELNTRVSCFTIDGSVVIDVGDNEKADALCLALREVFK